MFLVLKIKNFINLLKIEKKNPKIVKHKVTQSMDVVFCVGAMTLSLCLLC